MLYNHFMDICNEYLDFDNSYKSCYIRNNNLIKISNPSVETLYQSVMFDIDLVLNELCVAPSKKGFRYWKDAVFIFLLNQKAQIRICKEVYPAIATKYGKTAMSVERAMRACFEDSMYNVSKKEQNYITEFMKSSLLYPKNSDILFRLIELISSQSFQKEKNNSFYGTNH